MNKLNVYIRRFLRVICALILCLFFIFRIAIPYMNYEPLYLDKNDGYVVAVCFTVLLSIDIIKKAIDKYIAKKSNQ